MIVRQQPRGSALDRARDPEASRWDLTHYLLAEIVDSLGVANWQRGRHKRRDFPKPYPRPGVEPVGAQTYGKGAIPVDDMAEWLGWN